MIKKNLITIMKEKNLDQIVSLEKNPIDFRDVLKNVKTHSNSRPEGFSSDRRNGNLTIYCPSRRNRPKPNQEEAKCNVCDEDLPSAFSSRKLPSGNYAFLTENRFSFFNPDITIDNFFKEFGALKGINFLLWPTTEHKEIHEISYEDHSVSFELIGEMEYLIKTIGKFPYVLIVKNSNCSDYLKPMHGQYHITGFKVMSKNNHTQSKWKRSKADHEDLKFERKNNMSYSEYVSELFITTFPSLKIRDYGEFTLAVHPNMRRPLEAIIYPKDLSVKTFSDLNQVQRLDLAKATSDVSYALSVLMPAMNMQKDYAIVFHNLSSMYSEIFPASQRVGGFERQRIYVCESSPSHSANLYKEFFKQYIPQNLEDLKDIHERKLINKEMIESVQKNIVEKIDKKYS